MESHGYHQSKMRPDGAWEEGENDNGNNKKTNEMVHPNNTMLNMYESMLDDSTPSDSSTYDSPHTTSSGAMERTYPLISLKYTPPDCEHKTNERWEHFSTAINSVDISAKTNEIYLNRLKDIDRNARGDLTLKLKLKLRTYDDWVQTLVKVNGEIIKNMQDMTAEIEDHVNSLRRKMICSDDRHIGDGHDGELSKYRHDINLLLQLLRRTYQGHDLDMDGMDFQTLQRSYILSFISDETSARKAYKDDECFTKMTHEKSSDAHVKALANEVAGKHDEICALKRQLLTMEDDISKAQKKIKLKEDVIRELRNDLKKGDTNNKDGDNKLNSDSEHVLPIGSHESQRALDRALNELRTSIDQKEQNFESTKSQIAKILQDSEDDRQKAVKQLYYLRNQLTDLLVGKGDDQEHCAVKDSDLSADDNIVQCIRGTLKTHSDLIVKLRGKNQELEMNKGDLETTLQNEMQLSKYSYEALNQVAEQLCSITSKSLSLEEIYQEGRRNPLCAAIKEWYEERSAEERKLCNELKELHDSDLKSKEDASSLEREMEALRTND